MAFQRMLGLVCSKYHPAWLHGREGSTVCVASHSAFQSAVARAVWSKKLPMTNAPALLNFFIIRSRFRRMRPYFLKTLSRRLVAQEETKKPSQASTKANSVFPSTSPPVKKGETTPSSRGRLSFKTWCTPSFRPSGLHTKQRGTQTNRRCGQQARRGKPLRSALFQVGNTQLLWTSASVMASVGILVSTCLGLINFLSLLTSRKETKCC